MTINQADIGKRIKAALNAAKVTQKELAKALGVSESAVSAYTHGDSQPSAAGWVIISRMCDRSIDYLITGKERPPIATQPTKEDALLLAVTSDPATLEKIKDKLRHQIREETPAYTTALTNNETRLLKAFSLLDGRRQERLIDTAEDMSVALLRGSGQEEDRRGENCAGSNDK
jgi:transcriptional regulator with XRE-family HTH domain